MVLFRPKKRGNLYKNHKQSTKSMEKACNLDKNAQRNAILYAFNYLKAKGVCRNQKQFASLLGVSEQTISYAVNNKGRSLNDTLVRRVADYMIENYSVDIYTPAASLFVTGDAIAAENASADSSIKTDESVPRPLYEVASSHLARRTFAQIAYSSTGDRRLTASMTGHSENSRAFNRYSEVTRDMKKRALGLQ